MGENRLNKKFNTPIEDIEEPKSIQISEDIKFFESIQVDDVIFPIVPYFIYKYKNYPSICNFEYNGVNLELFIKNLGQEKIEKIYQNSWNKDQKDAILIYNYSFNGEHALLK